MSAATPSYKEEIRRAEKLRRSGQTRLAAEVPCNVLAADKEHFAANYCLGMLHHRAGRNDLAIPLLEKAVAARPTVFEAAINLGIIQRDEGLLLSTLGWMSFV